mmetsp:Transcript_110220/g.206607  ORF Transcript_110220/g.206607 Transcript_110220/m.206607 type:complete len:505 (+) Transcript_110220:92-1606(+)
MDAVTMYVGSPWTWTPAAPVGRDASPSPPPMPAVARAATEVVCPSRPKGQRPRVPPPVSVALRCLSVRRAAEPPPVRAPRRVRRLEPLRGKEQAREASDAEKTRGSSQVEEEMLEEALLEVPRASAADKVSGGVLFGPGGQAAEHAPQAEASMRKEQRKLPSLEENAQLQEEVEVCSPSWSSAVVRLDDIKDDAREGLENASAGILKPMQETLLPVTEAGQAVPQRAEGQDDRDSRVSRRLVINPKLNVEIELTAESDLAASAFGSARRRHFIGKSFLDSAFDECCRKSRRRSTRRSINRRHRDSKRLHSQAMEIVRERDQGTDRFWRVYDGVKTDSFENVRPAWKNRDWASMTARQDLIKRQEARAAKLHRLIRCGKLPEAAKAVGRNKGFAAKMESINQKVNGALELMSGQRRELSETRRALEKVVQPNNPVRGRALSFALQAGLSARFQESTVLSASSSSESESSSEDEYPYDDSENSFGDEYLDREAFDSQSFNIQGIGL